MAKQDDLEFLVGREKHERAVALLEADPAVKLAHERFADAYAKRIVELSTASAAL